MPKGTRNRSVAFKQDGKVLSGSGKWGMAEEGRDKARIRVGDSNLKLLDAARDSEPVYADSADLEKKQAEGARKYNMGRTVEKAKKRARAAEAARVKDAEFSEAIEMVRKKKSTKRSDYQ